MNKYSNGGLSGLVNLGNTCFINSAIQCLSHTEPFKDYFLNKQFENETNHKLKLTIQWYRLLNGLWEENCTISPISFLKCIQKLALVNNRNFSGNIQNDIQEFLIFFFDILHEELKHEIVVKINGKIKNDKLALDAAKSWSSFYEKEYSIIIELFYGQIYTEIKDFNDKSILSQTFQPLNMLILPIPNKNDITIYDCLNLYLKEEILENDNKWENEKTNEYVKVRKNIKIWNLPKILIVSFNRFNNSSHKINKFIEYPTILDLSTYCNNSNNNKFELYGICNHLGNSFGGHYLSYVKHTQNWYTFNDSSVTTTNLDDIVNNNAYCLFYKKC